MLITSNDLSKARVSVIIPTYNNKKLLRETIDSVFNQTYRDLEVIIVDDGSTDGTPEMIQSIYADKVRCRVIPHSGLPATARNAGIEIARGAYIAFLDSDDLWVNDKLERQINALEEQPDYGWSYGNAACFGPSYASKEPLFGRWRILSGNIFRPLLAGNFVPASTVVVRASCLKKIGIFDVSPTLRAAEDYELWLRLAYYFPAHGVPASLAHYRVYDESISNGRFNPEPGLAALETACRKLNPTSNLQRKAKAAYRLACFRRAAKDNPSNAVEWLQDSCRLDPGNMRAWWYRSLWALGGERGCSYWLSLEHRMKLLLS